MPFINTKVSIAIGKDKEESLTHRYGKAISLVPGKSESWLMLSFEDNCRMAFKGSSKDPAAFVEVKIFGGTSGGVYDKLTAEITDILNSELGIRPDQIYIKYEECSHWGWNGGNF